MLMQIYSLTLIYIYLPEKRWVKCAQEGGNRLILIVWILLESCFANFALLLLIIII